MTAAKHTSPRDPSFRRSLLRTAGGAVGLVVGVAAIFGVLGMIGRDDADPVLDVAEGPEDPAEGESPPSDEVAGEDPPAGNDEGTANGGDEGAEDSAPEDDADEQPGDADDQPPDTEEEPADADEDDSGGTSEDEAPAEEPTPSEPAIDPASISVQVLDGYRQDGGAAAATVYQQLESAGYNIIARNPAIAYEVTTVLWTAGHEAEGRQVAQEIGAPDAREQPGNLSTQVNVHVVVGSDRG